MSLMGLTLIFHTIAMCRDPGSIKKPFSITFMQMMQNFNPVLLCPDCEIIRTDRSRHCSICNQCVERFDHHCPWINNCVGLHNHNSFMLFLIGMTLTLITTATMVFINLLALYDYAEPRELFDYSFPETIPLHWYVHRPD